jgi:hypothetical protein
VGNALLILVILEASLLGSGRLVQFGPLTLKMILFAIAQAYVIGSVVLGTARVKISILLVVSSFVAILSVSTVIGLLQGATFSLIAEDIKPLSYFCMIVFFDLTIRTQKQVELVLKIFKAAAVILSTGSLLFAAALYLQIIPFSTVYAFANANEGSDLMFRGSDGLFLYKGAVYIGVGIILFAFDRGFVSRLCIFLGVFALFLTNTRGFFVALVAVACTHIALNRKQFGRKALFVALSIAVAIAVFASAGSIADREASDQLRKDTIYQVRDQMNPISVVLGHGLGKGVPERPVHMEPALLEIFHKQGLLGILWWVTMIAMFWSRFSAARVYGCSNAEPLLLCALFVGFESLTNPYMNNPIGMTIWMVSLVALKAVKPANKFVPYLSTVACAEIATI